MPNRIIKESICTSESLDRLTFFQEAMFYRLITQCDDYGCFDARPKILASRCFPLKDIREKQIEDALRAMTSEELVVLYEVDGKPFGQMKSWDRHQQIRAKRRKYPAPPEGLPATCNHMISDDITCNHMQAIAPVIQSNPNPNPNPVCANQSNDGKTYKRPSLWEVEAYCTDHRFFDVNPQKFLDYQTMRGWKDKYGAPIEDWQAALRYWAANENAHRAAAAERSSAGRAAEPAPYEQRSYTEEELRELQIDLDEYIRMNGLMEDK